MPSKMLSYRLSSDENHEEGNPIWAERLEDGSPNAEESLRRTQTRETLERIVEELLVRLRAAFRLLHQFRAEARFYTWLGSIVLNSARMQLRRPLNHNRI